jgi:hypothetical protein
MYIKNYFLLGHTNASIIYIGLIKENKNNYTWINGAPVTLNFWIGGSPSSFATENCAVLHYQQWEDIPCHHTSLFMCERNATHFP